MVTAQGETKVLKLKNLRPQDYASYTCQVSVRNVCGIPDKAVTFWLTNTTGTGTSPPIPFPTWAESSTRRWCPSHARLQAHHHECFPSSFLPAPSLLPLQAFPGPHSLPDSPPPHLALPHGPLRPHSCPPSTTSPEAVCERNSGGEPWGECDGTVSADRR